jgi:hypothetical protein
VFLVRLWPRELTVWIIRASTVIAVRQPIFISTQMISLISTCRACYPMECLHGDAMSYTEVEDGCCCYSVLRLL